MTATNLGPDVVPIPKGWRVTRNDGTQRTVLPRMSGQGWAVFSGDSSDRDRTPLHGYSGRWRSSEDAAIDCARTEGLGSDA